MPSAALVRGGSPFNTLPIGWNPLKVGAGGWLRGLNIACDAGYGSCAGSGTSTKTVRNDTYGAHIWCAGCNNPGNAGGTGAWIPLVTTLTMPVGDPMNAPYACLQVSPSNTCGVFELRIAPSDTNTAYMSLGGYIYKSTNFRSCASATPTCTWAATGFGQDTTQNAQANSGGGGAQFGPRIDIDYADPSRLIVCGAACKYSLNGGVSFTTVSGATASATGSMVRADPSTTSGGATSGWYICSTGNGCYHSTTGPNGTFSLTSSGPTTISYMAITPAGKLYVAANDGTQTLWSFTGSWSSQLISGSAGGPIQNVAVDPASSNNVVVQAGSGQLAYSTNAAASFGNYVASASMSRTATDIPWLGFTNETYMTAGQIEFDPAQSNKLFFSEGIGAWTTSPSTGSSIAWTSQSAGIEQLVANRVISPPGSFGPTNTGVNVAAWDRPQFYIGNPNVYPSTHGAANPTTAAIVFGWSIDYASANPLTIFGDVENTGGPATSSNGGLTGGSSNWALCGSSPSGVPGTYVGGTIMATSSSVLVWVLSNGGPLNVSTDGCATWSVPTITGVATSGQRGWDANHFVMRQPACADRVTTNTFYAYNGGANVGGSTSTAGIYKGVWNGTTWTWTQALTGHIDGNDGDPVQLICSPTTAGKMFYTSGSITGNGMTHPQNQLFYKCTDSAGTVTCNSVANVKEVWAVGLGKPAPGQSEAAIYIAGYVSNVWGLWRSIDDGASWTNLGVPLNSLDTIKTITGDNNTYGYVYLGFSGMGYAYGNFN